VRHLRRDISIFGAQHHHRQFLGAPGRSSTENQMSKQDESAALSAIELMRIAPMPEAAKLAGVSEKTLLRNFRDRIVKISPRRQGMRVKDALMLKRP
jgi:hypothetical protein